MPDPMSIVAAALAAILLLRLFIFHPTRRFPKILSILRSGPKTFDEIQEIIPDDPRSLDFQLEFLEFRLFYIVQCWRGPWDKHGFEQNPWVYDITPIGKRVLDNPDSYSRDRD